MSMMKKLLAGPAPVGVAASDGRRHLRALTEVPVAESSAARYAAPGLPWPPPELELGAPPLRRPEPVAGAPAQQVDALRTVKRSLMVMLAIGIASIFAGQGTFASFSAETSNNGSSIASGTLTLSNTVNSNSACVTTNAATANNINPACGAALTFTNVAPGVYGGSAQITLQNTGSIDASKLYLWASSVNSTLTTGINSGATVTSLAIAPLEGNISVGDSIQVSNDTHTQTFVATAAASGGATSITVTSQTANYSYPSGATVTDTSSNSSTGPTLTTALTSGNAVTSLVLSYLPGNIAIGESIVLTSGAHTQTFVTSATATGSATAKTISVTSQTANFSYPIGTTVNDISSAATNANIDCYDSKTTVGGTSGATFGTNLNFNPLWGNPLCGTLLLYIQEISQPVNLSSALSTGGPITSLPVTALATAVASGDPIIVTSGAHTQTFTASGTAAVGATAIPVSSLTPNFAYPTTSAVLDPSSGNYCWVGKASAVAPAACDAPISVNPSSALSTGGPITSLPVTALNGDVVTGDTIQVKSGTNTQTFTASGNAYVGATAIPVSSLTPNFAYPTTSTVTDVSANTSLSALNSDTTDTISNFDTSKSVNNGKVELVPVTANGTTTPLRWSSPTTPRAPSKSGSTSRRRRASTRTSSRAWHPLSGSPGTSISNEQPGASADPRARGPHVEDMAAEEGPRDDDRDRRPQPSDRRRHLRRAQLAGREQGLDDRDGHFDLQQPGEHRNRLHVIRFRQQRQRELRLQRADHVVDARISGRSGHREGHDREQRLARRRRPVRVHAELHGKRDDRGTDPGRRQSVRGER